jgi:tetratricopeptide (TPR) repeat protein
VTIYQDLLKRKDLTELQLAVIRNNLAFLYAISSQGERALEVIGDAISQLGPRSDFLDTRGLAHLSSGNVEAAVADLRKAVEGGQGDGSTFFHLALAESKSGNVPEAVAAIQEAIGKGLTEEQLSKPEATLFRNLMKELQPHLPAESVE